MRRFTSRLRRWLTMATATATAATSLVFLGAGTAAADPSANAWYQLRMCESSNRYDIDTGNGYYGAYQFSLGTWASVGGTGKPSDAKPAEQDYRALMLYRKRGWSPWTCAVLVGLHEDADARSGVMPPAPANFDTPYAFVGGTTTTSTTAPTWPGRQFTEGDSDPDLKTWQKQLAALGYNVVGTGYFGPATAAAVRDLQKKAGLNVTGLIGPETWTAAWTKAPNAATQAGGTTGGTAGGTAGSAPGGSNVGTDPNVVYKPQTKADCSVGASKAPPPPSTLLAYNQTKLEIQCFQWQAASRGAGLSGTAFFGSVTLSVVTKLQQQNGITDEKDAAGRPAIGPKTWTAAWQGTATF